MEQDYQTPLTFEISGSRVAEYVNKVYLWMAAGLLATAGCAAYSLYNEEMLYWSLNHAMMLFLALIGTIFVLGFCAKSLSPAAMGVLFMVFSGIEGLTLAPIFLLYTESSIATTFAVTAGMFGATALFGACTKRDLSGMGNILFMGLIGIIIAGVVNIFLGNSMLELGISVAGVLIFSAFTAYDMQNIIRAGFYLEDGELRSKGAVMGALALYLDFINLFLLLLRLLGDRRD